MSVLNHSGMSGMGSPIETGFEGSRRLTECLPPESRWAAAQRKGPVASGSVEVHTEVKLQQSLNEPVEPFEDRVDSLVGLLCVPFVALGIIVVICDRLPRALEAPAERLRHSPPTTRSPTFGFLDGAQPTCLCPSEPHSPKAPPSTKMIKPMAMSTTGSRMCPHRARARAMIGRVAK